MFTIHERVTGRLVTRDWENLDTDRQVQVAEIQMKGNTTMKTLKLTFATAGKRNYVLNIENAKDDLTLDEVKNQAAKLMKVLINRSGAELTELIKAEVITSSTAELQ